MKKVVRVFKKVLLLSSAFICLNACKLFTGSLKEYFEYYTGTAAVAKVDYPETCGTTSNGIPCVDSKTDKVFTVYLRNPQKYGPLEDNSGISFYWEFNNKYVDENYYPDIKLNEDCVSATLTFSQAQLVHIDKGDATDTSDGEGRIIKDLSGKIRIFSGITQSYFDGDYELKVMANSAPERIRGAIFQLPEKRVNSPNYIIAFNAYQTKGTVHQNDTHDIYIGKNHWTFTDDIKNLTPVFVEDGCSLSATSPAVQLYDLDDNDSTFESLSSMGYVPLYFTSNKKFATNSEVVSYKISIKDSYGLEASTIVSNQAHELYPPKFISLDSKSIKGESEANDKMAYPAQEETGTFKYVIKHDGSAFYLDADGIPRKGNSTKTPPMIKYQVYQGSTLIKAGDKQSPVVLELPSNKEYYVKAYAYYDGYVDSKETQSMKFAVSRSNKYYVSADAETEGATGSKNNPYSTVQECITAINEDIKNFAKNSEYYIYLLTDMESEKAIIYLQGSNPNSDNYCDSLKGSTVKFIGANGVRKLVAIDETVVSLTNMPEMNVELENLVITSKYGNSNCAGKGIDVSSSNNFNILLENVTVKDCTPESGSAVDCNITGTDGKLTLSNSSVINNTLSSGGYGILVYGSKLHLKNKVVIKDNYSQNGSNKSLSNLYLPKNSSGNQTVLTLDGALSSGSEICIGTESEPTPSAPVVFSSAVNNYLSVIPSAVFSSDAGFAVRKNDSGCLTLNAGGIGILDPGVVGEGIKLEIEEKALLFTEDSNNTFTAKATLDESDITSSVTWSYKLFLNGDDYSSSIRANKNKISIIKNDLPCGKYSLYLIGEYQGNKYSANVTVNLIKGSSSGSGSFVVSANELIEALSSEEEEITLYDNVTITSAITVTKNHVINGNGNTIKMKTMYVGDKTNQVELSFKNVTIEGPSSSIYIYKYATVNFEKGFIIQNIKSVPVTIEYGTLNMKDGSKIINNNSNAYGGGVKMTGGTFTMDGGEISGNTALSGGGIYMRSGTFTMNGGKISNNTAERSSDVYGGGISVFVQSGDNPTITINDGEISGNKCICTKGLTSEEQDGSGGGIGIYAWNSNSKVRLIINGGIIKDNEASGRGGGVYVGGTILKMTGGTIEGNHTTGSGYGGGVFVGTYMDYSYKGSFNGTEGSTGKIQNNYSNYDGTPVADDIGRRFDTCYITQGGVTFGTEIKTQD